MQIQATLKPLYNRSLLGYDVILAVLIVGFTGAWWVIGLGLAALVCDIYYYDRDQPRPLLVSAMTWVLTAFLVYLIVTDGHLLPH